MLDGVVQDLRYATRTLVKNKAFTAFAIITAGLAIGATTAVYSTVDWMLNRDPGGVVQPERLVTLRTTDGKPEPTNLTFTFGQYEQVRAMQDTFADLATYAKLTGVYSDAERAEQIVFEFVTGNYFEMLGLRPAIGRVITPADDVAGAPPVVMLSYAFWMSKFGGDPRIIERSIMLDGQPCRVIGIVPREFEGYSIDWNGPSSVWLPVRSYPLLLHSDMLTRSGQAGIFFPIIARLRSDVSMEVVRQKTQAWVKEFTVPPTDRFKPAGIIFQPSSETRIGSREVARQFFGVLLIVCGLILLAACFNIANFLIGRAASRRSEIAIRLALGATRSRLVRQLMIEAGMLGIAAAGGGVAVAIVLIRSSSTMPKIFLRLPITTEAVIDLRMLMVAVTLGVASAALFGLIPAILASVRNPFTDLKNPKPHWSWGGLRLTPRQVLLIVQVGLAVMLAVVAGLYARSFSKVAALDAGYASPKKVLLARVVPYGMSREKGTAFFQQLLDGLNSMPGVVSASIGWNPPYFIGRNFFSIPGREEVVIEAGSTAAAPRFFETLGQRVLAGREFNGTEDDIQNGVIINKILADKLWPNQNAVGQTIMYGREKRAVTGVIAEQRCRDIMGDPEPCSYRPFPMGNTSGYIRVRTQGDPTAIVDSIRRFIHGLDPNVALAEEKSLDAHLRELAANYRMSAFATMALAIVGIALLAAGCVSLFISMVRDSVREIAIRMALGASNNRLAARILLQGSVLTLVGIVIGTAAAIAIAKRLTDQLYRVSPSDPVTFTIVPLLVFGIGIISVYCSAVMATKTDPAQSLRAE